MRIVASLPLLLAVAAGCAGCDEPAERSQPDEVAVIVAALGDSITAGSPLWDPDPAVRERILAPERSSQYEYWAARELEGVEFRNCGVFGERTDEIAQRLDDCAEGANVLIVQGGINDIAQGRPVSDAADETRSMVTRGKELGLETYIVDVLPWNNGPPAAGEPIAELNREIGKIADETGVTLIPFHDTLEDPSEPGVMAPAVTDDGDHPSVEGYRRLGVEVAKALDR